MVSKFTIFLFMIYNLAKLKILQLKMVSWAMLAYDPFKTTPVIYG